MAVRYYYPYWEPAHEVMKQLMGTKEEILDGFPISIDGYRIVALLIKSVFILILVGGGIYFIFRLPFCDTNIICLLLRK